MSFYADIKHLGPKKWAISVRFVGVDESIMNYSFHNFTKQEAKIEAFNQFRKYLAENREKVAAFIDERKK